jgi:predicted lipid carrier protein YhbT
MSQILTLELNDQVFAAIRRQAENIGVPPENLAATVLEQKFSHIFRLMLTDADKVSGQEKFERHFGAIDLNFTTCVDNESIDADLAKEYSSTHEEE